MADTTGKLKVFLCHASENQPIVKALFDRLARAGYEPWMESEGLLLGMDPDRETRKALRLSDAVIVCLSRISVVKEGRLQAELKLAQDIQREKPGDTIFLIPLRLDDVKIPFELENIHWGDYTAPNGFEQLVRSLNVRAGQLGKEKGQVTPAPPAMETTGRPVESVVSSRQDTSAYEPSVFISYAWGDELEVIVNQLDEALQERGLKIIRDKRDVEYRDSIQAFMERIGRGDGVILVISDKYLRSPNCMFELLEIARNKQFHDRIFPIVLSDADIYDPIKRLDYVKYWEEKRNALARAMLSVDPANLKGIRDDMDLYDSIRDEISELTSILKDMNTLKPEVHRDSNFRFIYDAIEKRMKEAQQEGSPQGGRQDPDPTTQTSRRDRESEPTLFDLQARMQKMISDEIRVPPDEVHSVQDILSLPDSGAIKLIGNPQVLENAGLRGGGAFYDFVRRDQQYGYGSDIGLRDGRLQTGFAGADYGFILRLGRISFRDLLVTSAAQIPGSISQEAYEAWRFMWEYKPPRDIKEIRKHQRGAQDKVVGNISVSERSVAEEGASYLLRSLQIREHDILVAFCIQRVLPDRSMILVWKILKIFDTPVALGSEE